MGPARDDNDGARSGVLTAAAGSSSSPMQAQDVYEWLVRRRAEEVPVERILNAIRTAAGIVPLGGRAPLASASTALISSSSGSNSTETKPEDVFLELLLTCVELPASVGRDAQRSALHSFLQDHRDQLGVQVPTSNDDSAAWWTALAQARAAYFSARRAFFLVRMELLRVALFQSRTRTHHPHASVVADVVNQLVKDGLVLALLEELGGRDKLVVPAFYAHLMDADLPLDRERHLRHAQHAWEAQLLSEDELLRELLVLALQFTHERVPLARSTQVIEHLVQWPAVVVPELFSQHSLAVPLFQRTLRRVTALGSVVTLQLLHRASQVTTMENENEAEMITQWSRDFVVAEAWRANDVDDHHVELCEELTESGVLLVALATFLAKLYRRSLSGATRPPQQLEQDLQTVLKASEDARGFQQVRDVLRRLVFDNASPSQFAFLKSMQGTFGATSWELPSPTAENKTNSYDDAARIAVFQVVGATFLDDALSALGYVEHVEDEAQLNAMVKLIRPVLANHSVTEAVLQKRPMGDCAPEFGSALSTLLDESRAVWPQHLLPGLRVLTALCCGAAATSQSSLPGSTHARSPAVQLTLKELATKRQTSSSSTTTPRQWRRLPPDEFLEFIPEQELVVCKKAFAYADEGDRVLVAVGTKGVLDQDDQGREVVQWQLEADEYHNAWETLLSTLETLVDQIQSQPLIAIDSSELETFTAFLELVVQVATGTDASSVLTQVMQQWAHARLKQWWQEMGLPNGASSSADDGGIPAVLIRNKVSLRVLQSASREDLVAWGVHDRFLREQILARIAFPEGASSAAAHQQRRAASRDELEKDGLSHLVRMLLGFLDGFVNEHAVMAEQDDDDVLQWTPKQLHFVTAILAVLAKLTSSLDLCIDVLVHELGGGTEECVQLILKSTRKLFEYHESTAGSYSGLFASLTLLMNMSRWCVAHEAIGGVASGGHLYRATEIEFRAAERHWLIATVEFIMEIVATHETWRFVAIGDKWAMLDRCYRILTALLTARFYHGESDGSGSGGLRDFQNALRNTLMADKPLLMKLLRSASRLVATKEDAFGNDARAFALAPSFERSDRNGACLYPFTFEQEVTNGTVGLLAREALVASSLRLLDLVMEQSGASSAAFLMTPIDGDGLHERPALNLVTLAGGYLAYSLSKNAEIASISLKLLRRAVDATSQTTTGSNAVEMENRSLVTLFRETSDLEFIRDTLLDRVRSPGATGMLLRKELLDLLTSCLDNQPGFFAVLVLDEDTDSSSNDRAGGNKTKRLVAIVERFLESSDKLLETHTDVLCSILRFLRRIWLGGINERRTLHLQIASALRKSSRFWKHLTQVLRIRLPLSMDSGDEDDEWPVALDQDDDATDVKSIGRSGVFASLARGMILEIVACEWHHYCSKADQSGSHPLVAVLDAFREEGLYAHWLRTFTRLDYNASRFAEVANSVQQYVVPFPPSLVSSADNSETVLAYHESVVAALLTLRWQLGPATKRDSSDSLRVTTTWKRAKWSALASAQAAAQIHALGRWKSFMELYALQPGGSSTDDDNGDAGEAQAVSSAEHRKRKESMIATPPRTTVRENSPVSPRHPSGSLSSFSGDRTSYGIVQVLSETVLIQLHRHERDQERGAAPRLDMLSLTHLQEVVELLVAMLHHQTRVVVRKTRDPKLSSTRARDTSSTQTSRLTVVKSLELLALVEKATRQVMASTTHETKTAGHSSVVDRAMASAGEASQASLWAHLAGGSYEQELDALTQAVRTSLFTAALLLTRHVTAQHASGGVDHTLVQRAVIVQVKLTQHAIESIQLCDRAGVDRDTSRLFQVSWSLLQALLDEFTTLTVAPEKQKFKLDAILSIGPLVTLLQHETSGFCALVEIVTERFQPTTAAQQQQRLQACAVLRGLTAVVWNPTNAELCRHVMLAEDSVNGFSLLRFFAIKLVPRLRDCLAAEQGVSHSRGYVGDDAGAMERSPTHLAWCSVLMIAAGLVRQMVDDHASVWEFVASAEPLLAAALSSSTHRLTRATVEEQACVMTLLNALSASRVRRKQWRERLPTNCVVLMEQSRVAMRRACVLLGNSSYTAARQREQQHHAQLQKKPRRLSVTAWPLSTSPRALAAAATASLTFAHQTLLHEQLEATTPSERRHVTSFYKEMESKLVHVVEQGAHLLLKWTPSVASRAATVALDGTKLIDDEQLTPLLALVVPSDSLTLACVPSLGHLCIAMEFCVEQLKQFVEKQRAADHKTAAIVNALQTSALLFLQTYLLHADQQPQASQSDFQDAQKDFGAFFEQLIDELNESPQVAARVDVAFLQQILKVVQLQAH